MKNETNFFFKFVPGFDLFTKSNCPPMMKHHKVLQQTFWTDSILETM